MGTVWRRQEIRGRYRRATRASVSTEWTTRSGSRIASDAHQVAAVTSAVIHLPRTEARLDYYRLSSTCPTRLPAGCEADFPNLAATGAGAPHSVCPPTPLLEDMVTLETSLPLSSNLSSIVSSSPGSILMDVVDRTLDSLAARSKRPDWLVLELFALFWRRRDKEKSMPLTA